MQQVISPLQKQRNTAVVLVLLNSVLGAVYLFCTPQREDDFFISWLLLMVFVVLLQAVFVFSVKGKAPLLSKWLLGTFITIAVVYGAFIMYITALGKGFQH